MKRILLFFAALLVGIPTAFGGEMVDVTGTWNLVISSANLISGTPGNNITSSYSNTGSTTIVATTSGGSGSNRRVSIQRDDTLPAGVSLQAGIEPPVPAVVTLNNSPVTVTTSPSVFYETNNKSSTVSIYYAYSGLSVINLTAITYTITITFTIVAF